MREERKRIITQWMFPTIVLVIIIAGMIINFNIRSAEMATNAIEKDMIVVSERYSADLFRELTVMSEAAKTVSEAINIIGQDRETNASEIVEILYALYHHSPAYLAVFSDEAGIGITNTGQAVNLSGEPYFGDLLETGANTFVYVEDNGITGESAITHFITVPGDSGNVLITYFPLNILGDFIRKNDFDGDVLFMLMNSGGQILANNSDFRSHFLKDNMLVDNLKRSYNDEIRKMDIRIKNGVSGVMKVDMDGEFRSLLYSPFAVNNWYVIVGVNRDYVDRQERKEWEYTRKTLFQLAAVISGFIIVIIVANMLAKLRNTANTKELMEKADTDLLTGLFNKVATERRVMEYFATHPNEQAIMYVLDIDNFKKINDTMGHAFGDEVLRSLGSQITPIFRASDIIGRIGGDELIILLKNIYSDENLIRESTKVARFFHDFKAGEYVKYSATASIGAAIFPRDGKDFESMYKAADQALYMAKKRGKNQLAFYHDTFEGIVIKS
ncbi:MAG: sensor domain-containing diguanylate cyclase [Lachnospiraceae bacterium]|nr:sensor domain-containing diguanylate cyclase [Lachnospiraceae bacterium]